MSRSFRRLRLSLLAALAAASCAGEGPDKLLASAEAYLAKGDAPAAVIQLKNALSQRDTGEIRLRLAIALAATGEHNAAQNHYRQALAGGAAPEVVWPEFARTLLALGEFKRLTSEAAHLKPVDASAYSRLKCDLGEAYLALGEPLMAKAAFSAAREKSPDLDRAIAGEARAIAASGDLAAARKAADALLALQPTSIHALGLAADLMAAQGQTREAIATLERIVSLAPDNAAARTHLGALLIATNQLERARMAVQSMRKELPRDGRGRYLEGLLALRDNDPMKARDIAIGMLNAAPDQTPALLLAGAAELQLGSLATAADHLRKVISKHPRNHYARQLLVGSYLRQGQPGKAEEALIPALALTPDDPALLRLAGDVAFAAHRTAEAVKYYEKAAARSEGDSGTQTQLAQLRLAAGDADRALHELEATARGDKGQYQADLALFASLLARKDFVRADSALAVLEKKLPAGPLPHSLRATLALARQDVRGARAELEKALLVQPDYLPAARVLAEIDVNDKRPDQAVARIEALLKSAPTDEAPLLALAQVKLQAGRPFVEVAEAHANAVRSHPHSVLAHLAQGAFLAKGRDPQAALKAAQTARNRFPDDARVLDQLGLAQLAVGDTVGALDSFSQMAKLQPESPVPQLRLAAASYRARQADAPIAALRKALQLQPDLLEAQKGLVSMLVDAGRFDEAMKEAKALQRSRASEAHGYALEGDVLARQHKPAEGAKRGGDPQLVVKQVEMLDAAGRTADARDVAARWLQQRPDDPVIRYHLATTAMLRKDYTEAAAGCRWILAKHPDHVQTLNNLAWVLGEMKDKGALELAARAHRLDPDNPAVLDTYGWLQVQSGQVATGAALLAKAAAGAPGEPQIRVHWAGALIQLGDKTAARKALEEAAVLAGVSPLRTEIDRLLESL